jgi:MFS-type transporter involved in bile tolerance (Atg22 family)
VVEQDSRKGQSNATCAPEYVPSFSGLLALLSNSFGLLMSEEVVSVLTPYSNVLKDAMLTLVFCFSIPLVPLSRLYQHADRPILSIQP